MRKNLKQSANYEYLNFIKRNNVIKLQPQQNDREATSKLKRANRYASVQEPDTNIMVRSQLRDEIFPATFKGETKFNNSKAYQYMRMTNAQIQQIIESKKKSIMSLAYESVQISLKSNNVMLIPKHQKQQSKSSAKKTLNIQMSDDSIPVRLPDIRKRIDQTKDDSATILYNDQQTKQPEPRTNSELSHQLTRREEPNKGFQKKFQSFYDFEKGFQKQKQPKIELMSVRQSPVKNSSSVKITLLEKEMQKFKKTYVREKMSEELKQERREIKRPKKNQLILRQTYYKELTIYQKKISTYREFIFQINLAHNKFDPIELKEDINTNKVDLKYKAYVGKGNNSLLIKSLLQRRYWWTIQEDWKNANFAWTQLKINDFFKFQSPTKRNSVSVLPLRQNVETELKFHRTASDNLKSFKSQDKVTKINFKFNTTSYNKIFSDSDIEIYQKILDLPLDPAKLQDYEIRLKYIDKTLDYILPAQRYSYRVHNHMECNYYLGNKKAMFYNMRQYYQLKNKNVFDFLPLTFHIKKGLDDKQYKSFVKYFKRRQQIIKNRQENEQGKKKKKKFRNIWIVKPGENSNRGNGITVIDEIYQLNKIIKKNSKHTNGTERTHIVQLYIQKPLLYNKRKFDIRHYMLITTLYGKMRAYWYNEGYVRTSAYQFTLNDLSDDLVHLTNDAIQKYGNNYGKYQDGNKLSYSQLQRYINQQFPQKKYNFYQHTYPRMRQIGTDAVKSAYLRLDPKKLEHNFEIFGLDFMIDEEFNLWLIEINTNPCLEISSNLLARIIPTMVQQSFRLSIDVLFPPYAHYPNTQKHLAPDNALDNLKFELIFDEQVDSQDLTALYNNKMHLDCGIIDEEDDVYENEGKEYEIDAMI